MRRASIAGAVALLAAGSVLAAEGDPLVVTGDGVNVRGGPSTDASILMRVYRNQEATELAREGEWVRVEIGDGGRIGWIHGSLLAAAGGGPSDQARAPAASPPEQEPEQEPAAVPEVAAPAAADDGMTEGTEVEVPELGETAPPAGAAAREGPGMAAIDSGTGAGKVEPAAGPAFAGAEVERFKESVEYLNSRALQVAGVNLFTEVEAVDQRTVRVATTEAWGTVPPAGQRSYLNTLVDRWSAANGGEAPVAVRIVDEDGALLVEQSGP